LADNKDITVPSAGNQKLQPDILALGKTRDFSNQASDLRSGKFDTSLTSDKGKELLKDNVNSILGQTFFNRGSDGLLRFKGEKESFRRGSDGLLRRTGEKEPDLLRKTITSAPTQKRDVDGDGPKSTLRPSTKNSSAFGRAAPFSGWFPMKFKSKVFDSAVGGLGNPIEIPTFGLNPVAFSLGATTLQGLNFSGGFPTMDINQNSTAPSTTYSQAEDGVA
jgi:hypothetical protein